MSILTVQFFTLFEKLCQKRVKFILYDFKVRPIKCSGYIKALDYSFGANVEHYLLKFEHLRKGRTYFKDANIPYKNIRFIKSSFSDAQMKIINNYPALQIFFENHFENRIKTKKMKNYTKFHCIFER